MADYIYMVSAIGYIFIRNRVVKIIMVWGKIGLTTLT